ncbi:DUF397 domain-containing protein [Streptomyces sp. NPDC091272]|uniref:DUF397 domain-containing protein n=1 Tax=Streptomyces sp. NPDC091272 TaxID=3365981 RepID=UPI00380592B3
MDKLLVVHALLRPRENHMSLRPSVWHKSTYGGDFQDACVEACAAADGTGVQVQDSKDRGLGPLTISRAAWSTFLVSPYTEAGR